MKKLFKYTYLKWKVNLPQTIYLAWFNIELSVEKMALFFRAKKNVIVIVTTYYHNMAVKYLECLNKQFLFNKINLGYSPKIKKKRKKGKNKKWMDTIVSVDFP